VAAIDDLPLRHRLFLKAYRFRTLTPVPFAPPRRPLPESRVALVTTGAVSLPEQPPFDEKVRGGDSSYREIPAGADLRTLAIHHRSDAFDPTGFEEDRNLGFPLDRLHEMEARGEIGAVNRRHFSVMGSITATGRLVKDTAPAIASAFEADRVDAVLLVPL